MNSLNHHPTYKLEWYFSNYGGNLIVGYQLSLFFSGMEN